MSNHRVNTTSRAFRFSKSVRATIIRADHTVFAAGDKLVTNVAATLRDFRAGWRTAKVDDVYARVIKPAAVRAKARA